MLEELDVIVNFIQRFIAFFAELKADFTSIKVKGSS